MTTRILYIRNNEVWLRENGTNSLIPRITSSYQCLKGFWNTPERGKYARSEQPKCASRDESCTSNPMVRSLFSPPLTKVEGGIITESLRLKTTPCSMRKTRGPSMCPSGVFASNSKTNPHDSSCPEYQKANVESREPLGWGLFSLSKFQRTTTSPGKSDWQGPSSRLECCASPRPYPRMNTHSFVSRYRIKVIPTSPRCADAKPCFRVLDNQSLISLCRCRNAIYYLYSTFSSFVDDSSPKDRLYNLWSSDMWMRLCMVLNEASIDVR